MLGWQPALFILLTLALNPVTRVNSTLSLTDTEKPGKNLNICPPVVPSLLRPKIATPMFSSASFACERTSRHDGRVALRCTVIIWLGGRLPHPMVQRQRHQTHVQVIQIDPLVE